MRVYSQYAVFAVTLYEVLVIGLEGFNEGLYLAGGDKAGIKTWESVALFLLTEYLIIDYRDIYKYGGDP